MHIVTGMDRRLICPSYEFDHAARCEFYVPGVEMRFLACFGLGLFSMAVKGDERLIPPFWFKNFRWRFERLGVWLGCLDPTIIRLEALYFENSSTSSG